MTHQTWITVSRAIGSLKDAPIWLKDLAGQTVEQIVQLPKLDSTVEGQTAAPVVENKIVAVDYLGFLREQIRLNARGQEWTEILRRRLQALQPFVGKMVITAHFYQKPNSVTLRIDPETDELLNAEIF